MGNCLNVLIQTASEVAEAVEEQQQQQQQQQTQPSGGGSAAPVAAQDGGPPRYSKLPPGAERHSVRNVYDGDTLTLTDERRVRFLGIDTPEIKERQPYAQEAKDYTKSRCSGDVWLAFDGEREDHYGRLLAHVWVEENGSYLCVNEGIVAAGFASVYAPSKDKKTANYTTLLELQKRARDAGLGIHGSFEDKVVVKTTNGSAYHVRSCEHLANSHRLEELKVSEAQDVGLHPCRTCMS